jgi:hypothetical protein
MRLSGFLIDQRVTVNGQERKDVATLTLNDLIVLPHLRVWIPIQRLFSSYRLQHHMVRVVAARSTTHLKVIARGVLHQQIGGFRYRFHLRRPFALIWAGNMTTLMSAGSI